VIKDLLRNRVRPEPMEVFEDNILRVFLILANYTN
jgi:hypothetical protein